MLVSINLINFAIIDNLALSFEPGLNIITGETGTGKSIIVNSLNTLLGDKINTDLIKSGCEESHLEALFDISDKNDIKTLIDRYGLISMDDELLIKRVISKNGRSKNYINGNIVTLNLLKEVAGNTIDIFSQHEHQSLMNEKKHIELLDEYCQLSSLKINYENVFKEYSENKKKLNELIENKNRDVEKEQFLKFQLDEIDKADLSNGEDVELEKERKILSNSQLILSNLTNSYNLMYEDEDSILSKLNVVKTNLEEVKNVDESLIETFDLIERSTIELQESSYQLRNYLGNISFKHDKLETIEDRLHLINDLKRKYGDTIEKIIEKREAYREEINNILNYEEKVSNLEGTVREIGIIANDKALHLSGVRKKQAKELEIKIEKSLNEVGIKDARFEIHFDEKEIGIDGIDDISFKFSANPDQEVKRLKSIISGGELSRIMLVLKEALTSEADRSTLVFDEADSGIGGAVAESVGKKIKNLSCKNQVICITHLAQVAKFSDNHFKVEKNIKDETTNVVVKLLNKQERIKELARMISGSDISKKTYELAEELLRVTNSKTISTK
ncbi:MAG: DNA repair protein RecN [Thermodesulfobacteriota bacterium]